MTNCAAQPGDRLLRLDDRLSHGSLRRPAVVLHDLPLSVGERVQLFDGGGVARRARDGRGVEAAPQEGFDDPSGGGGAPGTGDEEAPAFSPGEGITEELQERSKQKG